MSTSKSAISILIIDDTLEDRETYKEFLLQNREYLYTFVEAEDAESGLEMARSVELDCILLDFSLPGMDGLALLEVLQHEAAAVSRVPVIFITGRGSEGVAVRALKAGAVDYLVKSDVNADNLYRATVNALQRHEMSKKLAVQERRRAETERELRESEERFRLLIDSVKDYALIMLDAQGRIVSWNSGARRIFDYHDTEIIGSPYRRLFTPEDIRAKIPEQELSAADTEGLSEGNRFHTRKNGKAFWSSGTLRLIRDTPGQVRGYVKIVRDETTLKNAEDALRTTVDELRSSVEARDEFLSVASHELKTPLTSMRLQVDIFLRMINKEGGVSIETAMSTAAVLNRQIDRMKELINDLLEVSRMNVGKFSLRREPADLVDIVREVVARRAQDLKDAGCSIELRTPASARGNWDRDRIAQVVNSLIGNAIKFAPGKPIEIDLESAGRELTLAVRDHGPGVSTEVQQAIFERFARVLGSDKVGGLGLGLYITKRIIAAHGGTIEVNSVPGKGARFLMQLPNDEKRP